MELYYIINFIKDFVLSLAIALVVDKFEPLRFGAEFGLAMIIFVVLFVTDCIVEQIITKRKRKYRDYTAKR